MENNETYDPMTALSDAQAVRDRVADRAAAPVYYYPVLGAGLGAFVAVMAVGGPFMLAGMMLLSLLCGLLISRYQKETGVWVTYGTSGPGARLVWGTFIAVLVLLLVAAVAIQLTHRPGWWGIPLGLAAFVLTVVTGRVIEPRLRDEIRRGATTVTRAR